MLRCHKCNTEKDKSLFSKRNNTKRGYSYICKECHNEYSRLVWYRKNRKKHIKSVSDWKNRNKLQVYATRYGLSIKDVKRYHEAANGACQICFKKKRLVLDHDHSTGEIRGFLCSDCNLGLGRFFDNTKILNNAVRYLSK
jgi:protein-arginine kinase activator protein McsA